uniref:ADP,ATP carrier protein 4 n=1 Tax=Lygus hesperus TaxID=30085 RepID=A0A0A9W967_LYGHE
MTAAEAITKSVAMAIGSTCYILMVFFSDFVNTHGAEKIIFYPIFSGFLVLYIAFAISVFLGHDTEVELNSVWGLYGMAAYIGAGSLLLLPLSSQNTATGLLGTLAGAFSYLMAVVLLVDIITIQNE